MVIITVPAIQCWERPEPDDWLSTFPSFEVGSFIASGKVVVDVFVINSGISMVVGTVSKIIGNKDVFEQQFYQLN